MEKRKPTAKPVSSAKPRRKKAPITQDTPSDDQAAGLTPPVSSAISQDNPKQEKDEKNETETGNAEPGSTELPQVTDQDSSKNRGNVASTGAADSFPGEELLDSSSRARLPSEKKHDYWERMRKSARMAGLPRGQGPGTAYQWATEQTDREFPPPELSPIPENPEKTGVSDSELSPIGDKIDEPSPAPVAAPSVSADSGVPGLSNFPPEWPPLPANAQLQAEIAWVTANRLLVRDGSGVNLSRAMSPPPSYSALSWLETSILFPSKFADISVKATADQDDEKEHVRRERLAIEEIRGILKEMLEAKD